MALVQGDSSQKKKKKIAVTPKAVLFFHKKPKT